MVGGGNLRTTLLKKGLREIWAHKLQYFFLILILALGVCTFSAFNDLQASRQATFDALYKECRFQDLRVEFQYGLTANLTTVQDILSSPALSGQVAEVEYRLSYDVYLNHTSSGGTETTKGIVMGYQLFGPDGKEREITVNRPLFFAKDPPKLSSPVSDECYLEHNFAKVHGFTNGGEISVINGPVKTDLRVLKDVGIPEYFIVMTEGNLMPQERTLGVVLVPMDTAQRLYGNPSSEILVNNIAIRLIDPGNIGSFRQNVTAAIGAIGIPAKTISKDEDLARYFIKEDMDGDGKIFQTFPLVIFTVSAFGLFMALRRMVQTHKAQIGIFKSLGVPDRVVLGYFASIGLMVAVLGILLGYALTIPLNMWFDNLMRMFFDFPVLVSDISWRYYIAGGLISMGLCLGCTLVPAWLALRIKPVDAIQQREGLSKRKVGSLAARLAAKSELPTPVKLTLRNLVRRPGRTTTSVLGVGMALALFLSFMIIMETSFVMIDSWNAVNRWDYEVKMDGFVPLNATTGWEEKHPEIESMNPGMILPSKVHFGGDDMDAILYAVADVSSAFDVHLAKGSLSPGKIVISFYHRDELGLDVGDVVQLDVPMLDPGAGLVMGKVNVTVGGIQDNMLGYFAFMDLGTLSGLTGLANLTNIIYLKTADGGRSQSLENYLMTKPGVSSVMHRSQSDNLLAQYLDLFMSVIYGLAVICTALAAAIIYNLFMISAEERRRDYATMKTLGTSMNRLAYLIFLEGGAILVPGILLGVIGGWALAYGMITFGTDFGAINFEYRFSWLGFFAGAGMMVGTVFSVSLLTIRYISKIRIADVIRERSS